mgnify:CR=1 FL=1
MTETVQYFGCEFPELARYPYKVTSTFGFFLTPELYKKLGEFVNQPVRLKQEVAVATLDKTYGSWAYGSEVQFHAHSYYTPKAEKPAYRFNDHVVRWELPFQREPLATFLFDTLKKMGKLVDGSTSLDQVI